VLLADFPGSKLYLILEQALSRGESTRSMVRRKLLPARLPARFTAARPRGLANAIAAVRSRCAYFLFRLRFHISAGSRYLMESRRWNHLRKQQALAGAYRSAACTAKAAE